MEGFCNGYNVNYFHWRFAATALGKMKLFVDTIDKSCNIITSIEKKSSYKHSNYINLFLSLKPWKFNIAVFTRRKKKHGVTFPGSGWDPFLRPPTPQAGSQHRTSTKSYWNKNEKLSGWATFSAAHHQAVHWTDSHATSLVLSTDCFFSTPNRILLTKLNKG